MSKFKRRLPRLQFEGFIPRLFLHERKEKSIRWSLRAVTVIGVSCSVITLPWYYALSLSLALVLLNAFLEKTLFYYTSLYVTPLPDFTYDPEKWVANAFVFLGSQDADADKIVGLVFNDEAYAKDFFDLLKSWNEGSSENTKDNFFLSFIIDEDVYYLYLYPNVENYRIKKQHKIIEKQNEIKKYGKMHLGLVAQMIFCKEFPTTNDFALGKFIEKHEIGRHFLLGPFLLKEDNSVEPIFDIEPISMIKYKAKIPSELTEEDLEYVHWREMVQRGRTAVCADQ